MGNTGAVAEIEMGRRERKRLATHRQLRLAALRLCAERGLASVTVEDIAEAVDVSTRTFYDHFSNKQEAIVGFDASRVDHLREALRSRPLEEAPLVSLQCALRELLVEAGEEWPLRMAVIRANPELLPRMFSSFSIAEKAMVDEIATRVGTDRDHSLYPVLVTAVATSALRSAIGYWRASGESRRLLDVFDEAFERVGDGLPAPAETTTRRSTTRGPRAATSGRARGAPRC